MDVWEISFRCPLCRNKFSAKKVSKHLRENHPDVKRADFLLILRNAEKRGVRVVERKKQVLKNIVPSAKSAFSPGRLDTVKNISFVAGGAIGLGKKR